MEKTRVICIGAGPAGLTASYLLSGRGIPVTVLEADPKYVGGISKTVNYKGFYFDIGGHRFFSKSKEIENLWSEILPNDMLVRPRSSRIYYGKKFYSYPLKASEVLGKLGIMESTLCILSYFRAKLFPITDPGHFDEWVTNQFGRRLFNIFFKTYTEKVWGIPCNAISADWATQRIKGLSLGSAIWNAVAPHKQKEQKKVIKTLINSFRYPRKGPGMMWEKAAEKTRLNGGRVLMGCKVVRLSLDESKKIWIVSYRDKAGQIKDISAEHVISSMPIRDLFNSITPSPESVDAANQLKYRDFLTVALILKDRNIFDDNWIYIHDPLVKVGRIQNFKSWSLEMIPDPAFCCYGLEYFCFEGDEIWSSNDAELIKMAADELENIGLAKKQDVLDGCVVRQAKAYPVYDDHYATNIIKIRKELAERYPNLHLVGRNGMHKYNNQDHAMKTAVLTVKNIINNDLAFDVWQVNHDAEYHEADAPVQ